ncbi:hypothetical protein AMTR_s02552p00005020, partial [Amborella trichopoda]
VDALVCSYCFRYIGSIELQIGRKLYLQGLGKGEGEEFELGTSKHIHKEGCLAESLHFGENHSVMAGHSDSDSASSSKSEDNAYLPLPKEVIESLINGELVLPYSKEFLLPSVISCVGGCAGDRHSLRKLLFSYLDFFAFHAFSEYGYAIWDTEICLPDQLYCAYIIVKVTGSVKTSKFLSIIR